MAHRVQGLWTLKQPEALPQSPDMAAGEPFTSDLERQSNVERASAADVEYAPKVMRVAMLIQSYFPWVGGAERQLQSLCRLFSEEGIEAVVITRRKADPQYTAFSIVAGAPVYRIRLVGGYATRSLSYTVGALYRLWKLRRYVDVLHAHNILSPATTAVLAKLLLRKPVVLKLLRGGPLGDVAELRAKRFGRMRMALITRLVDRFICISEEIRSELSAAGAPAAKLAYIPNGVDLATYAPGTLAEREAARERLGIPLDATVAIFTGRLVPAKGLRDLVIAWGTLAVQWPNAHLLIVGTGPEAEALRGCNVHALGARDDISDLLRASDIFVLPSMGEGLSNALLEAMATGLACIGSDVGGTQELLQHVKNGLLVPYGDPVALARELTRLVGDPDLRQALGAEARRTIEQRYSLLNTARQLRALYADVALSTQKASAHASAQ